MQRKLKGMGKAKQPKPKESGHWKPALWDTRKVRRYMRHVRKHALMCVLGVGPCGCHFEVFAILIELFDGVISRREVGCTHIFKRVILFRCQRCTVVFLLTDIDEKYGPTKQIESLENNPCAACKKGAVEVVGKFLLEEDVCLDR